MSSNWQQRNVFTLCDDCKAVFSGDDLHFVPVEIDDRILRKKLCVECIEVRASEPKEEVEQ